MARSIVVAPILTALSVFGFGVFAAQPPVAAPPPMAGPRPGTTPPAQAGPPSAPAPPAKAGPSSAAAGTPAEKLPYVEYPVDDEQKKNRTEVTTKIMRQPSFGANEQVMFDDYYEKYALARWSVPENLPSVPGYRKELGNHLRTAKGGAIHDHLNALALDFMRKMAAECHPAARFNAMLMIGELNALEPARPADLPAPLPAALPVLVSVLEDPQQIDVVKVAALTGILRHIKLGGVEAPNDVKAVGDAALAMVGSQRQAGRSADGHAWLRKLAAEVLGELGAVGDNGAVATTLAGMVAEAGIPFYARCTAAEALGKLNYPSDAGLDAAKLAAPLGRLAVDACTMEAQAQEDAQRKAEAEVPTGLPGPSPLSYGPEAGPGAGGPYGSQPGLKPPTQIPVVFRNRLKYCVNAASVGLSGTEGKPGGVASLAKGTPQEKFVVALQQQLKTILDVIEANRKDDKKDDRLELKAMMDKIKPEVEKLRALLAKPPV